MLRVPAARRRSVSAARAGSLRQSRATDRCWPASTSCLPARRRRAVAARGSHGQNQIVDLARREVCWVKYGNPRRFECWRWDDQFIYHAVDHGARRRQQRVVQVHRRPLAGAVLPADATAAAPWTLDVSQQSAGVVRRGVPHRSGAVARVSLPAARLVRAAARRRPDLGHATRWSSSTSRTIRPARPAPPSTTISARRRLVRVGALGLRRSLQPRRRVQRADGSSVCGVRRP